MHKRLFAFFLSLCLLCSLAPAALALNPHADLTTVDGFYAKQQGSSTCTLASAAMMVRRRAYLDGLEDWASLTEGSLRRVAWSWVGLSHQFTISGITVRYGDFDRSRSVTDQIDALLQEHPEGIVVYNRSYPHAILVTDYTDGVFYCSDPSPAAPSGRYPVSRATITISNAHSYWYVGADTNRPQGVGVSLAAKEVRYPTRLAPGSSYTLGGQFTSPGVVTHVQCSVTSDSGKQVLFAEAEPAVPAYEVKELSSQLDFARLTTGSYTLTLTAEDEYGGRISLNKQLLVGGEKTAEESYSGVTPVLSAINAINLTETGFDVECNAVSPDKGAVSVLYSAWADGNQFAPGLVAERDGDRFTVHVEANAKLLGLESLLINITAMSPDGNTTRGTLLVQVSPEENAEDGDDLVASQKLLD